MRPRDFFAYLLLSPLGLGLVISGLLAAAAAWLLDRPLLALLLGPLFWLAGALLVLRSGQGGKAVLRERDRRSWQRQQEDLDGLRRAGRRLASLRLEDDELKRLAQQAALATEDYVQACIDAKSHQPQASQAVLDCIELFDAWLEHTDHLARSRHFGQAGAAHLPETTDLRGRSLALLADRLAILRKASLDLRGGLNPSDVLAIKEEL